MKKATRIAVSIFLCEHIICQFGIPHKFITGNDTSFVNKIVNATFTCYRIKHQMLTLNYPQANDQAKAISKVTLKCTTHNDQAKNKMVYKYKAN